MDWLIAIRYRWIDMNRRKRVLMKLYRRQHGEIGYEKSKWRKLKLDWNISIEYLTKFPESKMRKERDKFDETMVDNFPELMKSCFKVNN